MLCADGSWLQVYHAIDERSKGMRIDRIESLSNDHDLGGLPMISSDLFTNDLDQHPLPPAPVELAVEDPLPRAKVETAVGHRHHNFAAHDLPL